MSIKLMPCFKTFREIHPRKVKNNILNMYHFFFYQYIFDSFN